ncbi:MAG: hypothetical protein IPH09_14125 [bacterium]|nr:hypothetical protein [bacterium]
MVETLDRLRDRAVAPRGRQRDGARPAEPAAGERRGRERNGRSLTYLTIRGNEELFGKLCRDDFLYLMAQRIAAPAAVREIPCPSPWSAGPRAATAGSSTSSAGPCASARRPSTAC